MPGKRLKFSHIFMANRFKWFPKAGLAAALRFLERVVEQWNADNVMSWSASVAFYTLLSLAPLLIVMVAIAGFVYGRDAAQGELVRGVRNLFSPQMSPAVRMMLTSPREASTGLIAAIFGGLVLFFGASSALTEIHDALNAIWHVAVDPNVSEKSAVFRLVKERVYSFGIIIGCGLLLVASLLLESWIADVERIFHGRMMSSGEWFRPVAFALSFVIITFVFTVIYKFIPDVDLNWRDVAVGGLATSLLFAAGKQLISLYISKTDMGSAYGAAGSLIVVLLWVYYSAQVFFLGAEFTKVYAETFGSRRDRTAITLS